MIRVGILGATGYTARELIRVLLRHPEVEIVALTSRQEGSPHIAAIHPQFAGRIDLTLERLGAIQIAAKTDCVFSCLPHGASAAVVSQIVAAKSRVVDFSADYRLSDIETYQTWYGEKHPDADRLGKVVYGLPELFRDDIRNAALVANPGCYPTAAILALAPLLTEQQIDPESIIVDAKSGISGAGRTPKLTTHFVEANECVSPYNVGRHRHQPEMEDVLHRATGRRPAILFTPHLVPMDRGILATVYARPSDERSEDEWLDWFESFYENAPFVTVVEHLPATKDTLHGNYCHLTVRKVRDQLIVFSAIDNLGKGASGAAVQNMNVMFGLPETVAL